MAIFFWKTQNVQTLNFLLVKHIDKDISDVKILITKEHPSRAVELAISFSENSTEVPISNTNFSNKVLNL